MSENVYASPQAELFEKDANVDFVLASRWQRLIASLVDTFIQMLIIMPLMYFTGGFEVIMEGAVNSLAYELTILAISLAVFAAINGKFLLRDGQTVGKKAVGIKIVDNGDLPVSMSNLLKRYAMYFLPGYIPVVGQLISFVSVLFIFGKEKRCLHDYVGNTKVIQEI